MKTLSEILNVNHSNVYVRRTKIIDSIKLLKEIYANQLLSKSIKIPFSDLKVHIADLKGKLSSVETIIFNHEQSSFAFGS